MSYQFRMCMKLNNLNDLLEHELQDLYSAESQIIKALPKMAKAASSDALKDGFETHLEESEAQKERLEQAAEKLGIKLGGVMCKGMEGLLKEGEELLSEKPSPIVDQALIAAAQRVEHYEIAAYGCAITFAKLLGEDEVVDLLRETINEEEMTDEKLTEIAESEQEEELEE